MDRAAVIEKLVYTLSNPVKDRLVAYAHQWPGLSGYLPLIQQKPVTATQPRHFFRTNGPMPAELTLTFSIPEALGEADEVIAEVRRGVKAVEQAMEDERRRSGLQVRGRRAVCAGG